MDSEYSLEDSLNHAEAYGRRKETVTPQEKYLTPFPSHWETYFENFDNKIIGESDSPFNKIFGYIFMIFSFIMTFLTQIENGPSICIFLFIIGSDYLGRWFLIIGAVTALIAQFPKRFCFRKRPYMRERALRLSKDKTSSFPSRAVVCSVAYAYAIIKAINYYDTAILNQEPSIGFFGGAIIVLLSFLSASFARVHLGVHYPSDCMVGFILGLSICLLSELVFAMPNIFGCPSCYANQCYPVDPAQKMDNTDFEAQNVFSGIATFIILMILLIGSNLPPLKFWDKSAAVFGSFGACIISQLLMVCPKGDSRGLEYVSLSQVSNGDIVLALILSETNLLLSVFSTKFNRKRKNITPNGAIMWNVMIYLIFTIISTFLIVKLRLSILF